MTDEKVDVFFPLEAVKGLARLRADLARATEFDESVKETLRQIPEWEAYVESQEKKIEVRHALETAEVAFKAG